jgi:Phytochelatin synthase
MGERAKRGLKVAGAVLLLAIAVVVSLIIVGPPKVPPEAIASAVNRDASALDRAFALPVAQRYGRQLVSQSNGSTCGPASLVNALRSLDGQVRTEASVLSGSGLCWTGMCFMGLSLEQVAELAVEGSEHTTVSVLRDLTPEAFHEHLKLSNDPSRRYIVNFTRKKIFDAGGGHHSPIGGYLEDQDLVLVLDVNRDFGPWLVERERLFAAIDTIDSATDKKRGLVLLREPSGDPPPAPDGE